MVLEVDQLVDNRYRVIKLLAKGGMGSVYKAWDTRLNRPVALKEMTPQPGLEDELLAQLRQQFEHEAQTLATFSHPNLVRVTDYFSWDENEYLVMDFVEGESLAERIKSRGAQSEANVLRWGDQLLDALAYCHRRGIIHRDIKPQNIIITPEGEAVLVDFGLVKLWDPDDPHTKTVMRGAGTPEYAPPEQYDGFLGHTDPRSDIYSLGATLYHTLTGQIPPTATRRMANPDCFVPPRRINAAITSATERAILKSMAVAMAHRFQSAEEMHRALQLPPRRPSAQFTEAAPARAQAQTPTPEPEPAQKPRRRLWIGLAAASGLCLLLAAGAVIGVYALRNAGSTPTEIADISPTPEISPTTEASPTSPPTPTSTPAPTPLPTDTPPPMAIPVPGEILLEDNFGDPGSGWEIGDYVTGDVEYADGTYRVTSVEEAQFMWGLAFRDFTDTVVDVEATQLEGPANDNNAYGVVCRALEDEEGSLQRGYVLRIGGDGLYSIQRIVDGGFEALVDWTASDVILQGDATNHIRAVCNGPHLALFVNGELLAHVEDESYTSGDIALTATTFEEEPTEIRYDNIIVTDPGETPLVGEVLLRDDFSDPSSGWETGVDGGLGYADGHYYVSGTDRVVWGLAYRSFSDIIIDVTTTQVSGPPNDNNAYGVLCRIQPDSAGDYYALLISGDGFYSIQRVVGGDYEPLVEWTPSDVIRQGDSTNWVRAICDGSDLALIVNGKLLAEVQDTTYTEGDIALAAGSLEPEPSQVNFDNLVVSQPLY